MKKKCSKKKQVHMQNECFKKKKEYKVPARIDALCKYARRVLTKALFIEIYPGIFDNEQVELYLSVDDIVQFCSMEKIGVATITCYMKHLYEVLKDHPLEHIYKFDNPSIFCNETGNNYETRARAMVFRMEILDPEQLMMFPYNTSAFKIFVAKMGNTNRKSFVWKRVKGHHSHFTINERSNGKMDITFELRKVENLKRSIK
ncbi:hypothetical protein CUMW_248810 [Citrus unshiu]|uniref:Uncharacterized protein n=1 Tax=Citrus unshiu TaxID=55188 RepID=A0A2H5QP87_CITUN|nr:hypothetical protein CUMW_248810 [Citrus unshiu]